MAEMGKQELMTEYTREHLTGYAQLLTEISRDYFAEETAREEEALWPREFLLSARQSDVSRILFGKLTMDMAGHLEQLARRSQTADGADARSEKRLVKELSRAGIELQDIRYGKNRNHREEVRMVVRGQGKDFYNVLDVARILSKIMKKRMLPLSDGYRYIHQEAILLQLEEDCRFQIESGYARAAKDGESISGDNYLLRDFGDGTFVAAIGDGMGSGEQACEDSEKALALLERYLETGLEIPDMICCCNRLFYLRRDLEQSVTMDVLECNQYTGEACFYKYGAAGSFLIRGKRIRTVKAGGMALGIHADAHGRQEKVLLKEGDVIIMLSDGVMDYYADRLEAFEHTLVHARANTLADLAGAILKSVIAAQGGRLSDDMTVLALQIDERDV